MPGSEWVLDVDTVIIAIGTSPNPLIRNTTEGLTFTRKGGIEADEGGRTAREGVFAGGDAVRGAATLINAVADGRHAAETILPRHGRRQGRRQEYRRVYQEQEIRYEQRNRRSVYHAAAVFLNAALRNATDSYRWRKKPVNLVTYIT